MTVFIDTAVPMYAAGGNHPLRVPCGRILAMIKRGDLDAVTSIEVVQEITEIVSPDRGFDQVVELRRIDPAEFAADPVADPA